MSLLVSHLTYIQYAKVMYALQLKKPLLRAIDGD